MTTDQAAPPQSPPIHLVAGIILVAVAWPLSWIGLSPWSEYTFFPLWLGYILTIDGLTVLRSGASLLTRNSGRFALLFAFSIPLWWLFEFANQFLENWEYLTPIDYGPLAYFALASLSFSTVMPAIFVTATFWRTFPLFRRETSWVGLASSPTGLVAIAALGLAMFVASLVFPDVAFPLVWVGVFLLIDPINALTVGRSITAQVALGRWDTVLVLFAAGITCGFFWEMWNFNAMPKWVYDVPVNAGPKLFEMPILGYGGYFPFALEIYAFYHLLHTIFFQRPDGYLRFDDAARANSR